jgi:hypothetical protein
MGIAADQEVIVVEPPEMRVNPLPPPMDPTHSKQNASTYAPHESDHRARNKSHVHGDANRRVKTTHTISQPDRAGSKQ